MAPRHGGQIRKFETTLLDFYGKKVFQGGDFFFMLTIYYCQRMMQCMRACVTGGGGEFIPSSTSFVTSGADIAVSDYTCYMGINQNIAFFSDVPMTSVSVTAMSATREKIG